MTEDTSKDGQINALNIDNKDNAQISVALHQYDWANQVKVNGNNDDLEEIRFKLNEDIYTALIVLITSNIWYKNALRKSEKIVIVLIATLSFVVQFISVVLIFNYDESVATIDDGATIQFADGTIKSNVIISQHHDPFHEKSNLSFNFHFFFIRIFAMFGLVFYLGGILSSVINARIVAMNDKLWWLHGISIVFQMWLLDVILVAVIKIMVHSTSIEDIFGVSVGFFFLGEVDEWGYSMIKPHISIFNQPGNDIFSFKILRRVNIKWYENHSIWLLMTFIWVIFSLFMILFAYSYGIEHLYNFSAALPTWGVALFTLVPPWIKHIQITNHKLKPFCQGIGLFILAGSLSGLGPFIQFIFPQSA